MTEQNVLNLLGEEDAYFVLTYGDKIYYSNIEKLEELRSNWKKQYDDISYCGDTPENQIMAPLIIEKLERKLNKLKLINLLENI